MMRPELRGDRDAVRETSERVTAQRLRVDLRRYYERNLETCLDLFEDARSGCNVFVPLGEVFRDRYFQLFKSRWPTAMELAREVVRLQGLIRRLSPRNQRRKVAGKTRSKRRLT